MKIGNSPEVAAASVAIEKTGSSTQKGKSGSTSLKSSAEASKSSAPEASTQLELSSTATQLLQSVGGTTTESFDAEKVQRITQAIADGKFSVNAQAVADKLLSNAQDVLAERNASH